MQHCTQAWTGVNSVPEAMATMLSRLPHARCIVTTLGARGSILLERAPAGAVDGVEVAPQASLNEAVDALWAGLEQEATGPTACCMEHGVEIM